MIKITAVEKGSIAEELELKRGDFLQSVNGRDINDRLDYRFHQSNEDVELLIQRGGVQVIYEIEKDPDEDIGLILEEMQLMACGNNCVSALFIRILKVCVKLFILKMKTIATLLCMVIMLR